MSYIRGYRIVPLLVVAGLFAVAAVYYARVAPRLPQGMITPAAAESETQAPADEPATAKDNAMKINLTPEQIEEAKQRLSPEQYNICFLQGTEPSGSGEYEKLFDPGAYHCAVCGAELFKSDTKYDSHSGWPAFWDSADPSRLTLHSDNKLVHPRIEVRCAKCGAHLGHVFDDGPKPTGKRYCINSLALEFVPDRATDATH